MYIVIIHIFYTKLNIGKLFWYKVTMQQTISFFTLIKLLSHKFYTLCKCVRARAKGKVNILKMRTSRSNHSPHCRTAYSLSTRLFDTDERVRVCSFSEWEKQLKKKRWRLSEELVYIFVNDNKQRESGIPA